MILLEIHLLEYSNFYSTQNDCFPTSRLFFFKQRGVILQTIMTSNHNFTRNYRTNECLRFCKIILYTAGTQTVYGINHHHDIILQVQAPSYTHMLCYMYITLTGNGNGNGRRQYMAARWSAQMTFSHDRRYTTQVQYYNIVFDVL